ncbi:MAG TPA: glycoside hydrolase family 15 protein [Acidobacteriaceae bacterium]|nr:glycoside hydrolase family 15 protein [Acidobacteriaceae bacterium]
MRFRLVVKPAEVRSRIKDYALIGDCETAALVSKTGSIDWLCWPDFSSPACFAALLGTASNGRWRLAPTLHSRVQRRYRNHTLILETTFSTRTGKVKVTDFMPIRGKHSDIVRLVRGLEGRVSMSMELAVRFDYGRSIPWLQHSYKHDFTATAGPGTTYLRTPLEVEFHNGTMLAEFEVKKGQTIPFVLTYASSFEGIPERVNPQLALRQTERYWKTWAARGLYKGKWAAEVERSLITLKALTYRPTGGIVAAPTTSLPEQRGGGLNWDYRFCWLRDATFTLFALMNAGYSDEAAAWQQWLVRAVGGDASQVQILYGLRGERQVPEFEIPWLRGYQNSKPVRIGNQAANQFQLDIFGETADALYQARRGNVSIDPRDLQLHRELVAYLRTVWECPDSGIWEERGKRRQFVYSNAMAWVALDRAIKSFEQHGMEGPVEEWRLLRQKLHDEVCRNGFNRELNSFVAYYGAKKIDASLLLLPLVGFLPATDKRILGTIRAVEKHLMTGGFLKRNRPKPDARQGAFLACSFWLVQALTSVGRKRDAEKLFKKLLRLRNDVGLLSEEYDTRARELTGNFPQALSHIALVNAAFHLDPQPEHQKRG